MGVGMDVAVESHGPTRRGRRGRGRMWGLWLGALAVVVAAAAATWAFLFAADPLDAAPAVGVTEVTLADDAFAPAVIAVAPGTTVTWTWADADEEHNLVGDGWGSDTPQATGTFEHTFARPGTYVYECTLHGRMRGQVTVTSR